MHDESSKGRFWMLSAYYFFIYMGMGSLFTYLPLYYAHRGLTNTEVGYIVSLCAVVGILAQPRWGVFADRARTKNTVTLIALGGAIVCVWLMPLTEGFKIGLFLAAVVYTFFQCAYQPLSDTMTLEICAKNGYNFSTIRAMGSLGYAIIALVAGHILVRDIRYIFYLYSLFLLIAFLISLPLPKIAGHQREGEKKRFLDVLKNKKLIVLYVYTLIIQGTMSFFYSFHVIYSSSVGITTDVIGGAVMLGTAFEFPFMILFPRIYKRFPVVYILGAAGLICAVRWFMYAYALNAVTIYFIWILNGVGFIVFFLCLTTVVSGTVEPALRASGQAMNALVFGASRILGSMLGGFSADMLGIPSTFAIAGATCIMATIAFLIVARKMYVEDTAGSVS